MIVELSVEAVVRVMSPVNRLPLSYTSVVVEGVSVEESVNEESPSVPVTVAVSVRFVVS